MEKSKHIDEYLLITDHLLELLMDGKIKPADAKEINNALGKAAQFLKTKVVYGINRKKGESMDSIPQMEIVK